VITLSMLWLPILVSAVIVFIASNILWMGLPFWHRGDYKKVPDEQKAIDALAGALSGQYMLPHVNWGKLPPDERKRLENGPGALIVLRNPMHFSLGPALILYFLYNVVIAVFVGYLTARAAGVGAPYPLVFRIAGTAGILGYAFITVTDSIWYGKPWSITVKHIIDGVIYGLLMAGTFGWLWPR
jgi:hypothetical protein